jgi:hypothetical protein
MNNEIGRELKVADLKERQIVVVQPPGAPPDFFVTVWVTAIDEKTVTCWAGEIRNAIISFRTPDGGLVDDRKRPIRMFEYLGKP